MKTHLILKSAPLALVFVLALPGVAQAQILPYADVSGLGASTDAGDMGESADSADVGGDQGAPAAPRAERIKIKPYIEAQQVVQAQLKPIHETLTYSVLAAGLDAGLNGIDHQGSLSVRYERRFGESKGLGTRDNDVVSGVGHYSNAIVPGALNWEIGGMAARTSVQGSGAALGGSVDSGDAVTQIYSVYSGPTLKSKLGAIAIDGHYRAGYTKVQTPTAPAVGTGQVAADVFDRSTSHDAALHFGTRAGEALPVGVGVGGGWNREDVTNLDQRVDNKHVRGDLTLPVGSDLQLIGGVGYEKVQVSNRNALIDPATGLAQVDSRGRYVTDPNSARQIAYQTSGLIWDGGMMWRPSRRTALEAHVGRRYGSMSYTGSFAYAPNDTSSFNVSVYDDLSGFGSQLNTALANLPGQFTALRNPLGGDLGTCVAPTGTVSAGQSACLGGALGSVRSSIFRSRGITASWAVNHQYLQYGFAGGYDRRNFLAASGTVLAAANGVVDKNYWLAAYLNGRIDRNSSFSTNVSANWYRSGSASAGNSSSIGATAAYYRNLAQHLTASIAVGAQDVTRDQLAEYLSTDAMVGLRYSF